MNLQQTIDELEQQAAKYTQAAQSLRSLMGGEVALPTETTTEAPKRRGPKTKAEKLEVAAKAGKKRNVSPEARAKLSAMMKERHAARRAQREAGA